MPSIIRNNIYDLQPFLSLKKKYNEISFEDSSNNYVSRNCTFWP